jgi:hypothetical protein
MQATIHLRRLWGAQTRSSLQTDASRPSDRIYAPHEAEQTLLDPRSGYTRLADEKGVATTWIDSDSSNRAVSLFLA